LGKKRSKNCSQCVRKVKNLMSIDLRVIDFQVFYEFQEKDTQQKAFSGEI